MSERPAEEQIQPPIYWPAVVAALIAIGAGGYLLDQNTFSDGSVSIPLVHGAGAYFIACGIFMWWSGVRMAASGTTLRSACCPYCKEAIHREALVCPHCRSALRLPPGPPASETSSPETPQELGARSGSMIRATLCSQNAHKARELEALLPGWEIEPLDREDYPEETGATYYANARIKADFGKAHAAGWVLAEDSGVEVAALGGRPGVHSARYAPEGAPAIAKLLGELDGVEDRRARYVSELVLLAPDGTEYRGTGTLEGRIAEVPGGSEGFGYDPVFVPAGEERTVAELGDAWKAINSHRARAARALGQALASAAPSTTS